jgi:hypothetical protein
VTGARSIVVGDGNTIRGDYAQVNGSGNTVYGNHARVIGANNTVEGIHSTVNSVYHPVSRPVVPDSPAQVRTCVACLVNEPVVVILPCHHAVLCATCLSTLVKNVCPLCREEIEDTLVVFY